MSGFDCNKCKERFDASDAGVKTEYERTEAFGVTRVIARNCVKCPFCGSLDIDEAACVKCPTVLASLEDDHCENCRDAEDALDAIEDMQAIAREEPIRPLRQTLVSIARCAQMPLEELES